MPSLRRPHSGSGHGIYGHIRMDEQQREAA
jgi:hypothetical protein